MRGFRMAADPAGRRWPSPVPVPRLRDRRAAPPSTTRPSCWSWRRMRRSVPSSISPGRATRSVGSCFSEHGVGFGGGTGRAHLTALDETPGSATAALLGVLGTAARGCGWLVLVLALPLVFPDGRSPSRTATRLVVMAVTAFTVASLAAPVPLENRLADRRQPDRVAGVVAGAGRPAGHRLTGRRLRGLAGRGPRMIGRWRIGDELIRQQVVVFGIAFALPLLVLPLAALPPRGRGCSRCRRCRSQSR